MGSSDDWRKVSLLRFERQGRRCAVCGKALALGNYRHGDKGAWHGHHIDKDRSNNTLSNCAVVCINPPENCHLTFAHGGDYRRGKLAHPRSYTLNRRADFIGEFTRSARNFWRRFWR